MAPSVSQSLCNPNLSWEARKEVEEATRGQRSNPLWSDARRGRVTASNFGRVLRSVTAGRAPAASLLKSIHNMYSMSSAAAIDYGITHEATAIKAYEAAFNVTVLPSGLWLDESGTLGASPDGLTGEAMIEVKCPHSAKDIGVLNKIKEGKFYLKRRVDGEVYLDTTHESGSIYYHQIQGGLHLSGRSMCHLVVWAPADLVIIQVPKDPSWENNLQLLRQFHRSHVRPTVVSKDELLCVLQRN